MSIFGFFFFIVITILILGVSVIAGILRAIFGFGKRRSTSQQQQQQGNAAHTQRPHQTINDAPRKAHKKIFDKNEGEYVEFEEIKDE
ncbi:DUF4834 family protein [Bacteroides sp. OttesenSCG-928-D19]|nr:DUF4834 family protein [Bacteroides sp. OttesenSCG-928-D19]